MRSKKEQEWDKIRAGLKIEFEDRGITTCEIRLAGVCAYLTKRMPILSFAHRHKRHWYLGRSWLLGDFRQVMLGCQYCHPTIEQDKVLTEQIFMEKRGEEKSI